MIKYEDYISEKFSYGESMLDVERRVRDFSMFLLEKYNEKCIAIVAHRAPQLTLQVITQGFR